MFKNIDGGRKFGHVYRKYNDESKLVNSGAAT